MPSSPTDPPAPRIAVVDAANRFVRWEARRVIHEQRLVHRSIQLLLFDSQDRLVIQRRASIKQTFPDTWDVSCAGHVEEDDYLGGPDERLDEVYRRVAERELEEELGVRAELAFLGHFPPMDRVHYEHFHLYRAVSDGPYRRQPEEVDEIRPVSRREWRSLIDSGAPITPTLIMLIRWAEERGLWGETGV